MNLSKIYNKIKHNTNTMNRVLSIIFINGLAKSVSEIDLFNELNEYSVFSIKIPKNITTGDSFGYCFITFKSVNQGNYLMIVYFC